MIILLFESDTWLGRKLYSLFSLVGKVYCAKSCMENRQDVLNEILSIRPNYVIVSVEGKHGTDWYEWNRQTAVQVCVLGVLNVIDVCNMLSIHCTYFSSGMIYQNCEATEEDPPNFFDSVYSNMQIMTENIIKETYLSNTLVLRIRMPISHDYHPDNLIFKLLRYEKLINVANSVTVLDDMLPLSLDLITNNIKGIYNFVNPGVITHNEIMDIVKEYVDPEITYENFSVEEQNKILLCPRSNATLCIFKLQDTLESLYPGREVYIPPVGVSVENCLKRLKVEENKTVSSCILI